MKTPTYLEVVHGVDRHGQPLFIVKNPPCAGTRIYPHRARAYASALLQAADDCEEHLPRTLMLRRGLLEHYPLPTNEPPHLAGQIS